MRAPAAFHTGSLAVGGEHFLPLLKRLDECIAYVNSNLHYADASSFALKFRQLHSRALGSVRTHVVSVLRRASAKVRLPLSLPATPLSPPFPPISTLSSLPPAIILPPHVIPPQRTPSHRTSASIPSPLSCSWSCFPLCRLVFVV